MSVSRNYLHPVSKETRGPGSPQDSAGLLGQQQSSVQQCVQMAGE